MSTKKNNIQVTLTEEITHLPGTEEQEQDRDESTADALEEMEKVTVLGKYKK